MWFDIAAVGAILIGATVGIVIGYFLERNRRW